MSEVVILLGAGASVESGAPVMATFLDVAEDLFRSKTTGIDTEHFNQVFSALGALKHVPAQFDLDTYNLESVFSAFEMGAVVSRLGDLPAERIEAARTGMVRVIARTLQERMLFPIVQQGMQPTKPYNDLMLSIQGILQNQPSLGPPTIISLNYDLGLDFALHWHGIPYDYGLTANVRSDAVKLLKLHGSLNWGRCAKWDCNTAVVWDIGQFVTKYISPSALAALQNANRSAPLPIGDYIADLTHCDPPPVKNEPLIVPPTWNKSENKAINWVWRNAAKELSEARYLFLIGYSFPETDLYLRYLLALGLSSKTRVRKIFVVNPDQKISARFTTMIGPALRQRVVYEYERFSGIAGRIHALIRLDS